MARKNSKGRIRRRDQWSKDIKTLDGDPVHVIYRETTSEQQRKNQDVMAMDKLRREQAKLCPGCSK